MPSWLSNLVCCSGDGKKPVWSNHFEFMLVAISAVISSQHIWFSDVFIYNGGGIFLVPFVFFLVLVGFPITCAGLSLGQFTSKGPFSCWNFSPFFKGIGLTLVLMAVVGSIESNRDLVRLFHYLFDSFRSELPWAICQSEWISEGCIDESRIVSSSDECRKFNATPSDYYNYGTCTVTRDDRVYAVAIWNISSPQVWHDLLQNTPSSNYFRNGFSYTIGSALTPLGPVIWDEALISLLVWILVALALSNSVKSLGKVAYFVTICPLSLFLVFFVFSLTLDGQKEGLDLYWNPKEYTQLRVRTLKDFRTWGAAGVDILMAFSVGKIITLGSYKRFKSDTIRDAIILCLVYTVACLFSAIMIANFFGHYANLLAIPVDTVYEYTYNSVYVMMLEAFLKTSAPALWTLLWFIMLICFQLGSKLVLVEIIFTSLFDVFPKLRRYRLPVVMVTCSVLFLLGLPTITEKGIILIGWVYYCTRWNWLLPQGYLIIALIIYERYILIGWVYYCTRWNWLLPQGYLIIALIIYGIPRFMKDIEVMVGSKTFWCVPIQFGQVVVGLLLFLPTLVLVGIAVGFAYGDERSLNYIQEWPETWANNIGKVSGWTSVIFLAVGAIWSVIEARGRMSKDRFVFLFPTDDWGPALPEHRKLVTSYVPWFKHGADQTGNDNPAASLDEISLQAVETDMRFTSFI